MSGKISFNVEPEESENCDLFQYTDRVCMPFFAYFE